MRAHRDEARMAGAALWQAIGLTLTLTTALACGGTEPTEPCPEGTDGCPCAAGRLCDPGLTCEASLCASPAPADASAPDGLPTDAATSGDAEDAEDAPAHDATSADDARAPDANSADDAPGPDVTDDAAVDDLTSGEDAAASDAPDAEAPGCETTPAADLCACRDDADCASGLCMPSAQTGGFCSRACDDDCPEGLACLPVDRPGAEPRALCVARDLNLCTPCTDDDACQRDTPWDDTARCVRHSLSEGSFCGLGCVEDSDCPTTFACREVEALTTRERVRQCVPADAAPPCSCSARAIAAEAETTCTVDRCDGTRRCDAAGLTACVDALGAVCSPSLPVVVSFDAQGGTLADATTRTVYLGEPYGPLPALARDGYEPDSWRTEPAGAGVPVNAATVVTTREDHTLFAAWRARRYRVDFDSAGGTPCEALTVTFDASYGAAGPLCLPRRPGYAFEGWLLEGGGPAVTATTRVTTARDHVLAARWGVNRYTVRLDSEGGSACADLAVTFESPYGPLCEPTRRGFSFAGWHDGDDGTGSQVDAVSTVLLPYDHTLHARWTRNSYTVSFDSAGGTACPPLRVPFGAPYAALCAPVRPGFDFAGWFLGEAASGRRVTPESAMDEAADHTLVARWTPARLTVTCDNAGGAGCGPFEVTFGAAYGADGPLCIPTRPGYAFAGWFSAPDGQSAAVGATSRVTATEDHTLHASWTPRAIAVSLDAAGGGGCPATTTVTFAGPYGPLCAPTRAGFAFKGWWLASAELGGDDAAITAETEVTRPEAHTLSARWTPNRFTVAFESAGGTPCVSLAVTFGAPYGAATEGLLCAPTRLGWRFDGWFATETGPAITAATLVAIATDHTLSARWTADNYRVSLDSAGGSSCEAMTVTFASAYGPLCAPTRRGHAFAGWQLAAGDEAVTATTIVATASNHTLRARWFADRYRVSFEPHGGTPPSPDSLTVTFGAPFGPLPATSRQGHAFDGWWTAPPDDAAGVEVTPATVVDVTAALTLHARWIADGVAVTYDSDGGAGCGSLAVVYGQAYEARGPLCTPTRPGYAFAGWRLGGGEVVTDATLVTTELAHTLVAAWTPRRYRLSFEASGSPACPEREVTFDAPYGPLCAPSRLGFSLAGWSTQDRAEVTAETRVTTPADHTLSARWTANRYAVTFEPGEGALASPPGVTVTFGGLYGDLATASRPGYALAGWFTAPNGDGSLVTALTEVTRAEPHTLWAAWSPNVYTIAFDPAGGSACAPVTRTFGASYGPLCAPTRPGHALLGWQVAGGDVGEASLVAIPGDHTLVARWSPLAYTVTFLAEGGSTPSPTTRAVVFGTPYGTLPATSRTGYGFEGWWTTPADGGERVLPETPLTRPEAHSLHARWRAVTMNVTWDVNGGTPCLGADVSEVSFGAPYGPSPCGTAREGYDFGGWWTAPTGGRRVTAMSLVSDYLTDHRLHARWYESPLWRRLPAGAFTIGSPSSELGRATNEAQAAVTLTRDLLVQHTEVTQWQWLALSGDENPSMFKACGDTCPVESVSWWSALAYANARSAAEGLPPCYTLPAAKPDGTPCAGRWQAGTLDCELAAPTLGGGSVHACTGYRLPTEAEWEYAARAGTTTATYGGDFEGPGDCVTLGGAGAFPPGTPFADLAWQGCNNTPYGTKATGQKAPNAWGLHDTLGSVWEWTWDGYVASGAAGGVDPVRDSASATQTRNVRGGSWNLIPSWLRAAKRHSYPPDRRLGDVGLRLVRTAP